ESRSKLNNHSAFLVVIGLTLVGFALRVHQLGATSLWYDELLQTDISQGPITEILPQLERHAALPLDYYLLYGWIKLGRSEFWVRWPALFFGTLAIPLVYILGKFLFSRRVGLIAALLLSISSFAIQYSQEARPYALLLTLVLVAYLGLWQLYRTHKLYYWVLLVVGVVGSALTHYFALFMLAPMGLFVLFQQFSHIKQTRVWEKSALFALSLLLLFVSLILIGRFKFLYNVSFGVSNAVAEPSRLVSPATEKPNRGSGPPLTREFFVNKVFSPLSTADNEILLAYLFFFFVALTGLIVPNHRYRTSILLLLGWFFIPIVCIYLFLLYRGTFYAIRYILYTLPAYLMLVAFGLDRAIFFMMWIVTQIDKQWKHLFLPNSLSGPVTSILSLTLVCLLLLPFISSERVELQTHYNTGSREDWRAVGQLLHAHAGPTDAIIAVRAEPTMNWYYPRATVPFGTFTTTQAIWQIIDNHPRRWFILSSYSRRRDEQLRDWLNNNGAVVIGVDRRVVVYLQQAGMSKADLLAEVKTFDLPHKPITYASLANQLSRHGDLEAARFFYEEALNLADPVYRARLETELGPRFTLSSSSLDGF
ncbi:MAG: glycosyltransferase family 39 protein, partial [Chloroflexota bacterium]